MEQALTTNRTQGRASARNPTFRGDDADCVDDTSSRDIRARVQQAPSRTLPPRATRTPDPFLLFEKLLQIPILPGEAPSDPPRDGSVTMIVARTHRPNVRRFRSARGPAAIMFGAGNVVCAGGAAWLRLPRTAGALPPSRRIAIRNKTIATLAKPHPWYGEPEPHAILLDFRDRYNPGPPWLGFNDPSNVTVGRRRATSLPSGPRTQERPARRRPD